MIATKSSTTNKARRAGGFGLLAAAGILAVSACSSGTGHSTVQAAAGPGANAQPAISAPAPTNPPHPSTPVTIAVGSSARGPIVVDATGHTLYRFDKDNPGSGASACNGACAVAWPPAMLSGQPTAAAGLSGTLGVLTRADGTRQITLDGHPLYRYSGDQNPGDITGDGFGGIWHVVSTQASSATASAPAAAPAATSGYGA